MELNVMKATCEKEKRKAAWTYYAIPLFFALLVVCVRLFVGFLYHAPQDPRLGHHAGRYIFMSRLGTPLRGQFVLASLYNKETQKEVKLQPLFAVGIPGDTIEIYKGDCWINGKPWYTPDSLRDRSQIHWVDVPIQQASSPTALPIQTSCYRLVLRPGEYWLLSYSKEFGLDSRHCGPIHRKGIKGIARP